jgi:hypothetical protein
MPTQKTGHSLVVWLDRFLHCPEPFLGRYLASGSSS